MKVVVHGVFDRLHHLLRAFFLFLAEDLLDVKLAQRLAQRVIGVFHATLPARSEFFLAAQVGVEEVEVFIARSCRSAEAPRCESPSSAGRPSSRRPVALASRSLICLKKSGLPTLTLANDGALAVWKNCASSKFGASFSIAVNSIMWSRFSGSRRRVRSMDALANAVSMVITVCASFFAVSSIVAG